MPACHHRSLIGKGPTNCAGLAIRLIPLVAILIGLTIAVIVALIAPRLADRRVVFEVQPDAPKSFGLEMAWIAIRTKNTSQVLETLELTSAEPANWNSGIGTVYSPLLADTYVFVSPPIKGWTFVAGVPLPLPVGRSFVDKLTPLLARLATEFPQVQYFAGFPIIDFFAWAKLDGGRMVRAFAIGDEGVIWDRGRLTPEERALGLKLFDLRGIKGRKGDAGGAIILHPTEQQVLKLAGGWSLDPSLLDTIGGDAASGFIARAPSSWRAERLRKAA